MLLLIRFSHDVGLDLFKSWDSAALWDSYLQPLAETQWSWSHRQPWTPSCCVDPRSHMSVPCPQLGVLGARHWYGDTRQRSGRILMCLIVLYYSLSFTLYRSEVNLVIFTSLHFTKVTQHMVVVLHIDSLAVVTTPRFFHSLCYFLFLPATCTMEAYWGFGVTCHTDEDDIWHGGMILFLSILTTWRCAAKYFLHCCMAIGKILTETTHRAVPWR